MEDVETDTNVENTAGNPAEEEKLLPAGAHTTPVLVVPPADLLHGGNAVVEAQKGQQEAAPADDGKDAEVPWAERDLRETGLKESLPRESKAPSKLAVPLAGEDGLPRMHTYAEDMGTEIQKRGTTISSIITAEKMSEPDEPLPEASRIPWRQILVAGAVFLLILGIGAIGTVFIISGQRAPSATPAPASAIPVNGSATVARDPLTPLKETLGQARAGAQMNLGDIEALNVATGTAWEDAAGILTDLGAPNELARNSTGISLGLHAFNRIQPFMIISVSAYDRAFEAMLAWEPTLGPSLGAFFAPAGAPGGVTTRVPALTFTDVVLDNIDVRKSQDAWPILYAFPRQDLLVITTNENTLREILTRLSLQNASGR